MSAPFDHRPGHGSARAAGPARLLAYSPELESLPGAQPGPLAAATRRAPGVEGALGEGQLLEMAAELLEASGPAALDPALARLVARSARSLGAAPDPALAQALQAALRPFARRALPGTGLPGDVPTPSQAPQVFGLELEGLSPEDQAFELAKGFVRLAALATQHAVRAPLATAPRARARRALAAAARQVAPGLPLSTPSTHERPRVRDHERPRVRNFTATHHTQEPAMHDIDRNQMEYEDEQFEFGENEWSAEAGGMLNEAEEMELATELLSVSNEDELDQFLGNLLSRATKAVGSFARSPMGQAVGGVLKGVAKKALPMAGSAIGSYFGGPLGAKIGSGLANAASQALGLEGEMAGEDREFEGAKQFVRLAAQTASQAAAAPAGADPRAVAQQAAMAAARQLAPGLLTTGARAQPPVAAPGAAARGAASGRWLRRGNKIVIFGA